MVALFLLNSGPNTNIKEMRVRVFCRTLGGVGLYESRPDRGRPTLIRPGVEISAFNDDRHAIMYLGSDGVRLGGVMVRDFSFPPLARSLHSSQRPAKVIGSSSARGK